VIEAELELTEPSYYLPDLLSEAAAEVPAAAIAVDGTHRYTDSLTMQYLTLSDVPLEPFLAAAESHAAVEELTVIDEADPPRVQLAVSEEPPELTLAALAAVVGTSTVTSDGVVLRFELPSQESLSDVAARIESEHGAVSVRSKVVSERSEGDPGWGSPIESADLTEKQAAALRAAFHHGYYEQPRKSSAAEIADSLGVAHSTYLQHLRTAQQKVFSNIYEIATAEIEDGSDR
jgi:hypothetical protein